ncbi:MAG: type IV toxin-antitoxin system AbiEi family antitoxin domain-containing protein [Acidimicrobiia bacterium]
MVPFASIAAAARTHFGLVTRSQLMRLGLSEGQIKRLARDGLLERVHSGVFRIGGSPRTPEQLLLAATLAAGPGAVASHRGAAWLWGLVDDPTVEISVPLERLPRLAGVIVHRSTDLHATWRGMRRRIPTTSPMRTIVDLGAVAPTLVEDALDEALIARFCTVAAVERELARLARPGRSGAGVLRRVLRERALADGIPDSRLEPVMARLVRRYDLPRLVFQHDVYDDQRRFLGRVDFACVDLKVAIEIDGWSSRATPRRFQSDLSRQNALTLVGWTFLRFTKRDIVETPGAVAEAIRSHLRVKSCV